MKENKPVSKQEKEGMAQAMKVLKAEAGIQDERKKSLQEQIIDDRFKEANLLEHIYEELDKQHKLDIREKIALFIIRTSAELPNHREHVSAALKGDSSAGKDNVMDAVLDLFPPEDNFKLTRGTQSALEEEANSVKCIAFSEINAHREGGANSELTEVFKQLAEGGTDIIKKDAATGYKTTTRFTSDQKTLLYGTTETESDDELETRYVIIPIRGYREKNRIVVHSVLDAVASFEIQRPKGDNWVAKSIRALDNDLHVIIPYATLLKEKIKDQDGKEKEIFDLSKERIKRDVKRLMSLTKAVTWLHQKQRQIVEKEGVRYLIAEPSDFLIVMDLFAEFFNLTYSGLDHRLHKAYERIKELQGKHDNEIDEYGYDTKYRGWVLRHLLQEDLGIASVNTIKNRINVLKDLQYVDTFWTQDIPKGYLIRAYQEGVNRVSLPISLIVLDRLLTGYLTPSIIRDVYKDKKITPIQASFLSVECKFSKIDTLKIDTLNSALSTHTSFNPSRVLDVRKYVEENADDDGGVNAHVVDEFFNSDTIKQAVITGDVIENPKGRYRVL